MADTALNNYQREIEESVYRNKLLKDKERTDLERRYKIKREEERLAYKQAALAGRRAELSRKMHVRSEREKRLQAMRNDEIIKSIDEQREEAIRNVDKRQRKLQRMRLKDKASIVPGVGSDHKYRVAVTDAEMRRQRIKHKINVVDKAVNHGGFKIKPFETNLQFRGMKKVSVPRFKPTSFSLNMKSANMNMSGLDKKLKNFSFSGIKSSRKKRNKRRKYEKKHRSKRR